MLAHDDDALAASDRGPAGARFAPPRPARRCPTCRCSAACWGPATGDLSAGRTAVHEALRRLPHAVRRRGKDRPRFDQRRPQESRRAVAQHPRSQRLRPARVRRANRGAHRRPRADRPGHRQPARRQITIVDAKKQKTTIPPRRDRPDSTGHDVADARAAAWNSSKNRNCATCFAICKATNRPCNRRRSSAGVRARGVERRVVGRRPGGAGNRAVHEAAGKDVTADRPRADEKTCHAQIRATIGLNPAGVAFR